MKPPVVLHQVHVMDIVAGHEIPIGPAMDNQEPVIKLAEATNLAISKGRLHGWKDAHVVSFTKQVQ